LSKLSSLYSGVAWGGVSKFIVIMFQLIFMAIMARLLDPEDFGLVAIANVCLRFFSYFSQMGIAPAVIQKKTLDDNDIRAAFFLSLGVSVFFFLLVILMADLVEAFFEITSLAIVMQALAFNFLLIGFSSVSLGLMQRTMDFKALAIIEIISYIGGYGIIGLSFAFNGFGVWSLVAAVITQTFLTAALGYSFVQHSLALKHPKENRKHFISYGGRYSINGFVEFLTSSIDALIIGKFMGATFAGYYNRALLLANLPVQHPVNILTKALFPIMGGISDQYDKQSTSVQLSILAVGCYAFSVSAGIYIAAPEIVGLLLGDKWLEAIPILRVLAWSIGPLYISHVISVTFDSLGALSLKFRIQLTALIILVGLMFLAVPAGQVQYIAMAVVIVEWVRLFLMSTAIIRFLKIKKMDMCTIFCSIIIVTITTVACIISFESIIQVNYLIIHLIVQAVGGLFGVFLGFLLIRYIICSNSAVIYLSARLPIVKKLLPK
jgi:lipopolysaccharide exporter